MNELPDPPGQAPGPARRLLLVHAHPDDESITTGATMAKYAAEGAHVTLVTCTLGEEGDIVPPSLAHLAADRDDALGPYRVGELAAAMRELGVTDHRFLGGPGRYRDSGMMGAPQNTRPGAFWSADIDEAAALLAGIVREVRPQVLVTYDPNGGYGHPDHIQAHRVALRAAALAESPSTSDVAAPGHTVAKIYYNRAPRSVVENAFARLADRLPDLPFAQAAAPDAVPGLTDDADITTEIDGRPWAAAKRAALRAHATQLTVAGDDCFALSNALAQPLFTVEYDPRAGGAAPYPAGPERETDLFAGLEPAPGTGPGDGGGRPARTDGMRTESVQKP
jgi:N-acetyl-1-D-myo-inositol-2-amino-2-deoxy-alpha-D-glucopyranoside deacetylase